MKSLPRKNLIRITAQSSASGGAVHQELLSGSVKECPVFHSLGGGIVDTPSREDMSDYALKEGNDL